MERSRRCADGVLRTVPPPACPACDTRWSQEPPGRPADKYTVGCPCFRDPGSHSLWRCSCGAYVAEGCTDTSRWQLWKSTTIPAIPAEQRWTTPADELLNGRSPGIGDNQTKARTPIPVTARLLWSRDGEEFVPALAIGWTRELAHVHIDDGTIRTIGTWIPAEDVQRR